MKKEKALKRIEELEKENKKLREELAYYKERKASGRQKHNAKWTASYEKFVRLFEDGTSIADIAAAMETSERTVYRYKAVYEENKKEKSSKKLK